MVECLPTIIKALKGVMNQEWWPMPVIPEFWKWEARGSIQSQPHFHNDFEASLDYMKPCF